MLWKELEDRVYTILKNIDLTDREKAELILIEFNQYPDKKSLGGGGNHSQGLKAGICE